MDRVVAAKAHKVDTSRSPHPVFSHGWAAAARGQNEDAARKDQANALGGRRSLNDDVTGPLGRKKPATRDMAPLEPGQARVRVTRSDYDPGDGGKLVGDIVRMPRGIAAIAEKNGAVEIIEPVTSVVVVEGK